MVETHLSKVNCDCIFMLKVEPHEHILTQGHTWNEKMFGFQLSSTFCHIISVKEKQKSFSY